MTLQVLGEKGQKQTEIATTLGVKEGAVRYHLKRTSSSAVDGRGVKPRKADEVAGPIPAGLNSTRMMDSQKVHQSGCVRSVHPGVGVEPGGFTSLSRQTFLRHAQDRRDGEPAEPLAGDHAYGVTALQMAQRDFLRGYLR